MPIVLLLRKPRRLHLKHKIAMRLRLIRRPRGRKRGAEWEIEQLDERQILSEIDSSISPPTPQEYATQQTIVDNAEAVMCYWQPEWDQWQPIHSAWLDDWLYVTMYTEQIDSHVEQMQEAQGRIDMLEAEKLELIDWLNNN